MDRIHLLSSPAKRFARSGRPLGRARRLGARTVVVPLSFTARLLVSDRWDRFGRSAVMNAVGSRPLRKYPGAVEPEKTGSREQSQ
jgi:hypothetical protein